jgi:hypothetical protein
MGAPDRDSTQEVLMVRSLSCRAMIGVMLLALPALTVAADSNVRPQFSVASSMPAHWGVIDHGKALGLAVEVETSPRWSQIAEFDVHWLDTNAQSVTWAASDPYAGFPLSTPSQWSHATLWSGRFGFRFHMAETAKVRPYLQAGVGVRAVSGSNPITAYPASDSAPKAGSHVDGATAHMRFGFTTAGYRGAGLFLDGSAEALIRNPRDFALFPVRLGITLP